MGGSSSGAVETGGPPNLSSSSVKWGKCGHALPVRFLGKCWGKGPPAGRHRHYPPKRDTQTMGRDTFGVPASQPWLLAGSSAALKATLCWVLNSKGVPFLAPQLGKYVCSPRRPLNRRQGREEGSCFPWLCFHF